MLGFLGSLLALALFGTAQGQLVPTYQTSRYTAAISNAPPMDTSVQTWTNITAADDRVIYVPLGFDFVFWNKTFNSVNVSSNGNIQFRTSGSGSANTLFAPTNAGATSYIPIIAIYQLDLVPTTDRPWTYRIAGTAPNRRFILRATDIKVYLQPDDLGLTCEVILTEGTNTIDIYYYNVPISTRNLEAGIQDSASSLASSAPAEWIYIWNDRNVSTPELAAQFNGKAVRYTPLNSVAPGTPEPLPTCVPAATYGSQSYRVDILAAPAFVNDPTATNMVVGDDRVDYTPIGFPFRFYGQTFNSVNISSNGNLQFTTSVSGSSASFFSTGVSSYAPAIAFFHADMKPALPEHRTYAVQGTAPNRRFVVRYNDVPYCCAAYTGGEGVIVDAVLYETTNVVELIYYRIPSGTRDVEAGLQNIGTDDWVSIYNDQSFTVPCNNTYSNKLFRFTPAGNASAPSSSSTGVPAASSVSSPVVVRSSSSTPAVLSSSSNPAVLSSSASVPSSSSAPVAPSSSSTGLPAPSSSSVPVVIDSSSSVPVVIDSSSSVPVSVESSTAIDGPIDDPNLNGSASINSMVAFVVIAISMILAL